MNKHKHSPAHEGIKIQYKEYPITLSVRIDIDYLDKHDIQNPDAEDIELKLLNEMKAAPELLEALEFILKATYIDEGEVYPDINFNTAIEKAKRITAKARGEL